jgi:hypothetical protein
MCGGARRAAAIVRARALYDHGRFRPLRRRTARIRDHSPAERGDELALGRRGSP